MIEKKYEISSFRRGVNDIFALVGCCVALISSYRRFGTTYRSYHPLLTFLHISSFAVSVHTLYSHQSTHLPLRLLLLPVRGWLMAVLFLLVFSPAVGKSKSSLGKSTFSYAVSEMSYFYDLEKPGTFGVPYGILWDTGTELFKIHKTGTNGIPNCG